MNIKNIMRERDETVKTLDDLLSQQRLQDGQVSAVLQGEDNDLAGVVEPRGSGHIELKAPRGNERTH